MPFVCFVAVPIDKRHATVSSLHPSLFYLFIFSDTVTDAAIIMCVKNALPESRNICPVERADGDGRAEADHGRVAGSRGSIRASDRGYRAEQPCSLGSCKKYSARPNYQLLFDLKDTRTRDTRTTAHNR